jgi:hypothetical protein
MKKSKTSRAGEPAGKSPQSKPNPPQRLLVYTSRRLLTEKSSVTMRSFLLGEQTDTLTVHAIMATVFTTGIQGHNPCGLND